ncbi:MAG: PAAR-like domain-containing protein [Limnobaculum xujianqingii]
METQVYINDREACSKACDGVSTAAFPDPCWTPPTPPVVVPYPNTAYASDLDNGTSTVFVCNSMVAKEDISFFSTSTGDEGGTQAQPKNTVTSALKGKAYFQSWSPNVKFEGKCVARHHDLMTHNHGSKPGGTPVNLYRDSDKVRKECKKEIERVKKACSPEDENSTDQKEKTRKKKKNKIEKLLGKGIKDKLSSFEDAIKNKLPKTAHNEWMKDHCDGLWLKPGGKGIDTKMRDEFNKTIENLQNDFDKVVKDALGEIVDELKQAAWDKAQDIALKKSGKLAVRAGVKWGVGAAGAATGPGVVVTEGIATVLNAADAIYTGATLIGDGIDLNKMLGEVDEYKDLINKAKDELAELVKGATPSQMMSTGMGLMARLNECTRYKRCILPAYKNTNAPNSFNGEGCCPGQSGHHILPNEMVKGNCSGYKESEAPTICVEGVNNGNGTHGQVHDSLARKIKDHKNSWFGGDTIDYADARDLGIDSIRDTFPESKCSKDCLKAQLDDYYKDKCKKDMPAVAGKKLPKGSDIDDSSAGNFEE